MNRFAMLAAMLLAGYSAPAMGALIYSESVDGDFSALGNPLTELNLALGTNTVSGTASRFPFDFDSFAFVVPEGTTLTNLSWSGLFSGSMSAAAWNLRSGSAASGGGLFMQSIGSAAPLAAGPMGAGSYNLSSGGFTGTGTATGMVDYEFTFVVEEAAVELPEPGSFVLLGCGLALLAVRRRRG